MKLNRQLFLHLFFAFFYSSIGAQPLVADISPDIVYIDVDEIGDFSEGFAVVRKDNQISIIDAKGNFIIPFGKYHAAGFINGYCQVTDVKTKKLGFIDKKGNEVIPCKYSTVENFKTDGFCQLESEERTRTPDGNVKYVRKYYYNSIAKNQNNLVFTRYGDIRQNKATNSFTGKYSSEVGSIVPGEELGTFYKNGKYGFMKRDGSIIINPQFKSTGNFSDGVAKVQMFEPSSGKTKTGYIDRTGKLIIPYTFTQEPGDFHHGLAMVIPAIKEEFDFAYINKKGEVVIKIKATEKYSNFRIATPVRISVDIYSPNENYSYSSSIFWEAFNKSTQTTEFLLLDSTGQFININDVYKNFKYSSQLFDGVNGQWEFFPSLFYKNQLRFKLRSTNNEIVYGVVDLKGNIIFPPVFTELYTTDEASGLSRASVNNDGKIVSGYINSKGNFAIIIGQKSTW